MKLPHTVVIERATAGTVDDYNQPSLTYSVLAVVPAWVQPKLETNTPGIETPLLNEAGPGRARYTIFMRPTDVTEGDHVIHNDQIYELIFIADAAGMGHHLEIDANRVWP